MASLPRLPKNSVTLWNSPIQLFDSADHRAGTLFEHRSARVAEIGLVLPQALLDPGRIGNVASAEPEGVGRTGGPLLGVPRFSCAVAAVAQSNAATTAIQRRLVFEIISDHFL